MNSFIDWAVARLKERSTWVGIVAGVSALGVSLAPEAQEAIIVAGIALAGVIAVFTKDDPEGA